MRKSIKIFIAILVLALMLTTVVHAKVDIPEATAEFYVNDFANVFTSSEKARLMDKAITLSDEHDGIQVVITTIKSLDGNSVEDYSYEMYNQYGIGKNDMGLLILLATDDRKIRVEVGKSMEAYINDSKAGRFIDKYAIPYLKENKFNEGLINLQGALIDDVISSIENDNVDSTKSSDSNNKAIWLNVVGIFLGIFVILALIAFIVFIVNKIKARYRARKKEIENLNNRIKQLEAELVEKEGIARSTNKSLNIKINSLLDSNNRLKADCQKLESEYTTLKNRYERAIKLYPTIDSEITDMIEEEVKQKDMDIAQKADSIIGKVINLTASKDIVSKIERAKDYYSRLTQKQKTYVRSDITKLNRLYEQSLRLKKEYDHKVREERNKSLAEKAALSITAIISAISIGKASNLLRLREAKSIYDSLSSDARVYFDKSILNRLENLYKQAKRDKEEEERREREERRRREEEERRRRQNSYNHNSSSFGGFGGFGGHSGGGGASRGF